MTFPEVALAWCDVETTGLTAHRDHLLEVALQVTSLDLDILDGDGVRAVIYHPREQAEKIRAEADPYVQAMHDKSGLWEQITDPSSAISLAEADELLTEHIKRYAPEPRTARMAGNSIRLDLNFAGEHLPHFAQHLTYRMLDVSSWAGPAQWWAEVPPMAKELAHTAMADIRESIAEMRYLREALGLGSRPAGRHL